MPKAKPKQSNPNYERWAKEAQKIEAIDNPLKVPYEVALSEAIDLARFIMKYWTKTADRPGLEALAKRLPEDTPDQLVSLVDAIQYSQTQYLLIVDPAVIKLGERARFVINELESGLEFLLDDDVEEPADTQLAQIKEFHAQDGQRSAALAQSLRDCAALADSLKARLVEVDSDFDVKLIDEANKLAAKLMEPQETHEAELADEMALAMRNRLLHILMQKIGRARRTIAHGFRRHLDIIRESTSAYERRRRAAARRVKAQKDEAGKPKEG